VSREFTGWEEGSAGRGNHQRKGKDSVSRLKQGTKETGGGLIRLEQEGTLQSTKRGQGSSKKHKTEST